jgi:CheY-like chemotaxis protein
MLIVDDESALRWALSRYFLVCGFDVTSAENLQDALALADTQPFEVVLTDLRLGKGQPLGGFALASHIRQRAPDTRVVVLTALPLTELRERASEHQVDLLISKPHSLPSLANAIRSLLEAPPVAGTP